MCLMCLSHPFMHSWDECKQLPTPTILVQLNLPYLVNNKYIISHISKSGTQKEQHSNGGKRYYFSRTICKWKQLLYLTDELIITPNDKYYYETHRYRHKEAVLVIWWKTRCKSVSGLTGNCTHNAKSSGLVHTEAMQTSGNLIAVHFPIGLTTKGIISN